MSTPLRIRCPSVEALPPPEDLDAGVTPDQHVVLEFDVEPWSEQLEPIRGQLAKAHPQLSVFRSGPTMLTLKYQIPRERIVAHRKELEDALARFVATARALVKCLATASGCAEADINEDLSVRVESAELSDEIEHEGESWSYGFHGFECRFESHATGSVLEVRLEHWGEDRALFDPYFVGEYLHTTPGYEDLAALLPDRFHDTRRALAVLFP